MRVLLWHGYLLSGSGSNVYTANLAECWRRAGHDVLLMCQERNAPAFPFVDAHGDLTNGQIEWSSTGTDPSGGRVRLLRPDIGGLLPVYVFDEYPGFVVKTFVDLTDRELDAYVDSNVAALQQMIEDFRPDAFITGHEVMGPYIARQAGRATGMPYVAKLHGSALEFAVKKQQRYLRFATEGLSGASAVVGGSAYMVEEAARVVPEWRDKAVVVNPGCDTRLFRPIQRSNDPPRVGYVGKLIAAKGVHNLLASVGLVERPVAMTVVGYGGFEVGLRELASALRAGGLDRARALARRGEAGEALQPLLDFLEEIEGDELYRGRLGATPIEFTGRLEHGPLADLLPQFDLLVAPSVIPEAFGLVVAEAAACGVLPIAPAHSGIGEAAVALARELGDPEVLTYDPADPIRDLARAIARVLEIPPGERRSLEARAVGFARARWSWEGVARRLLEVAGAG